MNSHQLSPLPDAPKAHSKGAFGTWRGESRWEFSRSWEFLKTEKKWQWFGAFFQNYVIGGALVDLRYATKAFVWVFDRTTQSFVYEASRTLPARLVRVADDTFTRDIAKSSGFSIERPSTNLWEIRIDWEHVNIDINLVSNLAPFTAHCPVDGSSSLHNTTRKEVGLTARGGLRISGVFHELGLGYGLLDHSHGFMARETSWLWAMGGDAEQRLGFNAIQGFNADLENCIWTEGEIYAFDRATVEVGEAFCAVKSNCGALDLRMDIEGIRREDVDLKLVRSVYKQPLGVWNGTLLGQTVALPGVAEDHFARW